MFLLAHHAPRRISCRVLVAALAVVLAACSDVTTPTTPTTPRLAPSAPSAYMVPSSVRFTQLSVGDDFGCGIQTDKTLVCWGDNYKGRATPPTGEFLQVSAGSRHACAIRTSYLLVCWGDDYKGQATPPLNMFKQVSAGDEHSCAVTFTGAAVCWGNGNSNRLAAPGGTFLEVSAGMDFSCGLRTDAVVLCWGDNSNDQLLVPPGTYIRVSVGASPHACAVTVGGALVCWGGRHWWGNRAWGPPPTGFFWKISASYDGDCALAVGGVVTCWGTEGFVWNAPPKVAFKDLDQSITFGCGILLDGRALCWGNSAFGGTEPPGGGRVAPTATFNAPAAVAVGSPFTLSMTGAKIPGHPSVTTGFTYAFDCGSGYLPPSPTPSTVCYAPTVRRQYVRGKVIDQDGDFAEYSGWVTVNPLPGTQTITIVTSRPNPGLVSGSYWFKAVSGPVGTTARLSAGPSAVCYLSSTATADTGRVFFVGAGTCTVAADRPADSTFRAAHAEQRIAVFHSQTITFTTTPPVPARRGTVYDLRRANGGGSGNPVVFSSLTSNVCTVAELTRVSLNRSGTCTVAANQQGNATYAPAPQVTQSFRVE